MPGIKRGAFPGVPRYNWGMMARSYASRQKAAKAFEREQRAKAKAARKAATREAKKQAKKEGQAS